MKRRSHRPKDTHTHTHTGRHIDKQANKQKVLLMIQTILNNVKPIITPTDKVH